MYVNDYICDWRVMVDTEQRFLLTLRGRQWVVREGFGEKVRGEIRFEREAGVA